MWQTIGATRRARGWAAGMAMALTWTGSLWAADGKEIREFGCGEDLLLAYSEISRDLDRNPKDYALQALAGLVQELRGFPSSAREHYAKVKATGVQEKVSIECGPVKVLRVTPSQVVEARLKVLDGGKGRKLDEKPAPTEKQTPPPEEKPAATVEPATAQPPAKPAGPPPSAKTDPAEEKTAPEPETPPATAAKPPKSEEKVPPRKEESLPVTALAPLPTVKVDEKGAELQPAPQPTQEAVAPARTSPAEEPKSASIFDFWKWSDEKPAKPKQEEKSYFELYQPPERMPRISESGSRPGAGTASAQAGGEKAEIAAEVKPETEPEATPAPREPAPAPTANRPAAKSGAPAALLGTYSSEARARDSLKALNTKFAGLMGKREGYIQPLDRGDRGTAYRVGVRGFDSQEAATKFCEALKKQKQECVTGN